MRRLARSPAGLAIVLAMTSQTGYADAPLFTSTAMPELHPGWEWVAGAALIGLVVGFALGWRMLDRRIRKKYGGLKIY